MKAEQNVNVSALAAGVTTLFTVVGALTATGVLGRLERNQPDALTAAIIIVLLGSVMLVIAGLPVTGGRSEIFATLVGTGLTTIGIGWALAAGITTAGQSERPELHLAVDAKGTVVKGRVKAGNLGSERRLNVLVEGLTVNEGEGKNWDVATLAQYYVGPDGDGKVDMPVDVLIGPGEYSAVGIKAWPDDSESCAKYPRRVPGNDFKEQISEAVAGCVVLPLPAPSAAASAPASPEVTLTWRGNRRRTTRARLRVSATGSGGKLLVRVVGRRRGTTRQLLRTANRVSKSAPYRSAVTIRVGTRFNRVCARAQLLGKGQTAKPMSRCPLPRSLRAGKAGDELRRAR